MKNKLSIKCAACGVLAVGLMAGVSERASADVLTTTYAGGIPENGIMFDILPTSAIRLTGIQGAFSAVATRDITIFTKSGTFVGSELTPDVWTSRGTQSLEAFALNSPSEVYEFPEPIQLAAGERTAIYFRSGTGNGISYTNDGSVVGAVAANDANLTIFTGSGLGDLFTLPFADRVPNVTLVYTLVNTAPPVVELLGGKVQKTADPKVRVGGVATSDLGVATVQVRFQRLRANGSKRIVTRLTTANAAGLFGINVPTFPGRNRVRVTATDVTGQESAAAIRVLVRANQ